MHAIKKLATVAVSTAAIMGGLAVTATPASANIICQAVYNPLDPTSFVNVCADAGTYDADPGNAGFGVHAAGSASVSLFGHTRYCTDYFGAGANLNPDSFILVDPDSEIGTPGGC